MNGSLCSVQTEALPLGVHLQQRLRLRLRGGLALLQRALHEGQRKQAPAGRLALLLP